MRSVKLDAKEVFLSKDTLWVLILLGIVPAILAMTLFPLNWLSLFTIQGKTSVLADGNSAYMYLLPPVIYGGYLCYRLGIFKYLLLFFPAIIVVFSPLKGLDLSTGILAFPDELAKLDKVSEAKKSDLISPYDLPIMRQLSSQYVQIRDLNDHAKTLRDSIKELEEVDKNLVSKREKLKALEGERSSYFRPAKELPTGKNRHGEWVESAHESEVIPYPAEYPKGQGKYDEYKQELAAMENEINRLKNSKSSLINSINNINRVLGNDKITIAAKNATLFVRNRVYGLLYSICAFIVLVVYIFSHERLFKAPFLALITVLLLYTLVELSFEYMLAIGVFLLGAVSIYILRLAISQNLPIFKRLDSRLRKVLVCKSLVCWLPAAALIVFLLTKSLVLSQWSENNAYVFLNSISVDLGIKKKQPNFDYREEFPGYTLEQHMNQATNDMFSYITSGVVKGIETMEDDISRLGGNVRSAVINILYMGDPKITGTPFIPRNLPDFHNYFIPPSCSFSFSTKYIKCLIIRSVKKGFNHGYLQIRESSKINLIKKLDQLEREGNDSAKQVAQIARMHVYETFYYAEKEVKRTIIAWFNWSLALFLLSLFILGFAAINSFLTIFARLLYHPKYGNSKLSLREVVNEETLFNLDISEVTSFTKDIGESGSLKLLADNDLSIRYVAKDNIGSWDNFDDNLAFPQITNIAYRRFFSGRLCLPEVPGNLNGIFRAPIQIQYVKCSIPNGAFLVFNIKNLMAISGDIKLQSVFSMHVASKLLGQNFHSLAYGEGEVYLKVKGYNEGSLTGDVADSSVDPGDLVAFDISTEFSVSWKYRLRELYFLGIKVKSNDSSKTAIEIAGGNSGSSGVVRTLKYALLPV